uniref:Uncharacterized protein n=1 Tax=Chromera velia CCMP2878 TaxID=1169474 RepID=A0A0G4GRY2_9ALVE|eukprot:Cvel_5116.t1-p1 / transcript=Cvel_5116.t1 / gene=Cvel_5116 / organism=Chromera_velia_CCMP2878 / gene_product=hypothetical protein / transcript_product=hypothetical protein / location=Cvel_scaffold234:22346-24737(+) / protein_length=203 / sequence_SO=supercontig / SO=protein_coding / is_pseudo=false
MHLTQRKDFKLIGFQTEVAALRGASERLASEREFGPGLSLRYDAAKRRESAGSPLALFFGNGKINNVVGKFKLMERADPAIRRTIWGPAKVIGEGGQGLLVKQEILESINGKTEVVEVAGKLGWDTEEEGEILGDPVAQFRLEWKFPKAERPHVVKYWDHVDPRSLIDSMPEEAQKLIRVDQVLRDQAPPHADAGIRQGGVPS